MAREFRTFDVTVPANTVQASPATTDLSMPARIVRGVRLRIPPGPGGVVGFRLAAAGTQVIPWNVGAWIVGDNEVLDWPLEGQIESGAWQLQAYNTGVYDHHVYITFYLDPITRQAEVALTPPLQL